MQRLSRAGRTFIREIADALWNASASRFRKFIEGSVFLLAGCVLAVRLAAAGDSLAEIVRLPLTVVAVLLPFVVVLRIASLVLGSADERSSVFDDVAVGSLAGLLWIGAFDRLLNVRAFELDFDAALALGIALSIIGLIALGLVIKKIAAESARRRWSPARMRGVVLRELPQRLGPILFGPVLVGFDAALAWVAVAGLFAHGAAALAATGRARERALV